MLAAISLTSREQNKDGDTNAATRSKSKWEKSSKKPKSYKSEKKNVTSSPKPSPKKAKVPTTEENICFLLSMNI
jgi:hypothetical protein